MAKKKAPSADVRAKAAQMREAEKKREKRTRDIIVAVVAVLIVAIVAAIVLIIVNRPKASDAADAIPEAFAEGQAFVVSSEGVSAGSPEGDSLTSYFDYTCPGCMQLEALIGEDLVQGATAGDYKLAYAPVLTSAAPYNTAATAASLVVASEAPDLFLPLHSALAAYSGQAIASQDTAVITNMTQSTDAVKQIATQVGVPEDLIAKFDNNAAAAYLRIATDGWVARDTEGRENPTTPELVYDGVKLSTAGTGADVVYQSVLDQMASLAQ